MRQSSWRPKSQGTKPVKSFERRNSRALKVRYRTRTRSERQDELRGQLTITSPNGLTYSSKTLSSLALDEHPLQKIMLRGESYLRSIRSGVLSTLTKALFHLTEHQGELVDVHHLCFMIPSHQCQVTAQTRVRTPVP
jgi:hypothetical protein